MKMFPTEFSSLIDKKTIRTVNDIKLRGVNIKKQKMVWIPYTLSRKKTQDCIKLLDKEFNDIMKPVKARIPKSAMTNMRIDHYDLLPKTMSNNSIILNSRRGKNVEVANRVGLLKMLRSKSLREMAENITGLKLDSDPGCQIICYRHGDYVGPHTDHHPESSNLKNGYVDFHLTLSNEHVDHQLLVYENNGYLEHAHPVGISSGISASFLPFWHYTTPLTAKAGKEDKAKRWLLLTSFTTL